MRNDLARLQSDRILNHSRWLNIVLFLGVPGSLYLANPAIPFFISTVIPVIVGLLYIGGFINLSKNAKRQLSPRGCRKMVRSAVFFSCFITLLCSIWCVVNWSYAPTGHRSYYPIVLSMGALSTAFCLSNIRSAAIGNTTLGILPIAFLMLFSGSAAEIVASLAMLVATSFLIRMLLEQHGKTVDLISLQIEMHRLATQDALTGVGNRRAFDEILDKELLCAKKKQGMLSIALIDLNEFKPINDKYGHPAGDAFLRETASRLSQSIGDTGIVTRLGGDEFAIILACDTQLDRNALADTALTGFIKPAQIEGRMIPISASIGVAHYPADGDDAEQLIAAADAALYAAKAMSKGKIKKSGGTAVKQAAG
ncbi:MAG: GGDEF domain-containing protein [Sphingomonadales bacterium]|nr:GGDEF domain-containing protein [Sphingomonadales bacterium]